MIKKYHYYFFTVALLAGFLWGKYFYYENDTRFSILQSTHLKILVEDNFLPDDVIENFDRESRTHIELKSFSTLTDLQNSIRDGKFDLIWYKSLFAKKLMQEKKLGKYKLHQIENGRSIATDFKSPPYDKDNEYVIPIFWGVKKSILSTENISLYEGTQNSAKAYAFIDYLLQPDIVKTLVKIKRQASTSTSVEKQNDIEPQFKPSFLRKISIENLKYDDL